MGAVGSSADNAMAESFNATTKREVLRDAACFTDELRPQDVPLADPLPALLVLLPRASPSPFRRGPP